VIRTSVVVIATLAVALLLATNSAFAAVNSPLNGSFEDPSATTTPDNNTSGVDNWDVNNTIPFTSENWYNTWGYSRWGGDSSPYAYDAAYADENWLLALESSHDYAGYMGVQQDLGTMTEGDKYTFSGTLFGHNTYPSTYQVILYNVNDASVLSSITDIDFPIPMKGNEGDVIVATMDYTASASDEGDVLRLLLLPRNLGPGTHARTGIDSVSVMTNYYEPYRPQFHITPSSGWTNDPCGMYYADGLYHLHYLWNPDTAGWGHNWAHVVSNDMVHWTPWPISLAKDSELGENWSGSGLVDPDNTGGFKTGTNDVQVLAFTSNTADAGQNVGIAYSNDRGRTWTRYAQNPVLPRLQDGNSAFRDPKVFWHEPTSKWKMILSRGYTAAGNMFESSNLKDWRLISEMPPGECPDMFELAVDNRPGQKKWVYVAGDYNPAAPNNGVGAKYFIGDFDGQEFRNSSTAYRLGGNFFVGQAFNQIPTEDGRCIYMGWKWLQEHIYGTLGPWSGGIQTLPVVLTLRDIPEVGLRLCYNPAEELEAMRGEHFSFGPQPIAEGNSLLSGRGIEGELLEIIVQFQLGTATEFGLQLRKGSQGTCTVGYNTATQKLFFTPSTGDNAISQALVPVDGKVTLRIFLDRSVVDIFGNDGVTWNTEFFKADPDSLGIELYTKGGTVQLISLDVWQLAMTTPAPLPGDANNDGKVDDLDATALATNWLKTGGALWSEGDFNGDGNVNDIDATILAANWQAGVSQEGSVPEPTSLVLLMCLVGLASLTGRRRARARNS